MYMGGLDTTGTYPTNNPTVQQGTGTLGIQYFQYVVDNTSKTSNNVGTIPVLWQAPSGWAPSMPPEPIPP